MDNRASSVNLVSRERRGLSCACASEHDDSINTCTQLSSCQENDALPRLGKSNATIPELLVKKKNHVKNMDLSMHGTWAQAVNAWRVM